MIRIERNMLFFIQAFLFYEQGDWNKKIGVKKPQKSINRLRRFTGYTSVTSFLGNYTVKLNKFGKSVIFCIHLSCELSGELSNYRVNISYGLSTVN